MTAGEDRTARRRAARRLRAGQLPLALPPDVSVAMDVYQELVEAGELRPPEIQLPIPREAYQQVA